MKKIKEIFDSKKLELVVFICGAMGMVIELVAARILSPYVGSSNLIWTTIIGIMLVFMSLGYWIGGKIADKDNDMKDLSEFLCITAIAISLISILETVVVNQLTQIIDARIIVAIISATFLFGIPSFLLATASPIAVKLKNNEQKQVGKVSGKISSLSTIGSIFGTFFAGFVLIPNLGVSNIILGCSLLLFVLSLIIYPNKNKKYIAKMMLILIIIVIFWGLGKYIFKKEHPDIIKDVDSEYSRMWVRNITAADGTKYKTLQVDTGLESYIDEETGEMGAQYLKYYDLFEYYDKNADSTLMIGGAAYTYPKHYLNKYENKTIDVVEIDDKMTEIAEEEFGLDVNNSRLGIFHQDGRTYINTCKEKYDVILIDAFKGLNAPFELTTYEAISNAYNILNEDGIVITNIISSLEGEESDFIKYEYSTYKAIFDDVKVFAVSSNSKEDTQNLILVGIKGNPEINEEKENEYEQLLNREVKNYESDKPIVTDDFAPIGN